MKWYGNGNGIITKQENEGQTKDEKR